ncbi:radical SAM family heme chaperone HemW [bacterium]|nr:radical SAM family heme chaperone HemW [bacterium]
MAINQIKSTAREAYGVYVHIPFCQKKCLYCDFASQPAAASDEIQHYFFLLNKEIQQRAHGMARTLYFGGGTPSLAEPEQLSSVLGVLARRMHLEKGIEMTLEANPATVNQNKLTQFRQLGINRIALGVQSTQDKYLQLLGRSHTAEQAAQSVKDIRANNFENLSCDLIYGLPGQTLLEFQQDLHTLLAWNPEHISMYALSLEEKTPLEAKVRTGTLPLLDDDLAAEMYTWAKEYLAQNGFFQYELCSFSKPGFECQHNTIYWKNQDYLGLGAAAHSFEQGVRKWNENQVKHYMEKIEANHSAQSGEEQLQGRAKIAEQLIVGLRLTSGVNTQEIQDYYEKTWAQDFTRPIREMAARGLLLATNNTLRLTDQGMLLSNLVFREIL